MKNQTHNPKVVNVCATLSLGGSKNTDPFGLTGDSQHSSINVGKNVPICERFINTETKLALRTVLYTKRSFPFGITQKPSCRSTQLLDVFERHSANTDEYAPTLNCSANFFKRFDRFILRSLSMLTLCLLPTPNH